MISRKWIRRLAIVAIALVLSLTSLVMVSRWYARQVVIQLLTDAFGSPVDVASVRLREGRVSVAGVRIFEPDAEREPLLTIDRVQLNLTLWQVLRGVRRADYGVVQGGTLRVRLDERGRLANDHFQWRDGLDLTVDRLQIEQFNVEIHQPERTPLLARNVDAQLWIQPEQVDLRARIGDVLESEWQLSARIDSTEALSLHLTTPKLQVSTERIADLPLMPRRMTREVEFQGHTPLDVYVLVDANSQVRYRASLSPVMEIHVPGADLPLARVKGDLQVQNNRLTIERLQGEIGRGQFDLRAELEPRSGGLRGRLQGQVGQINISRLPASWSLAIANRVRGIVSGSANLVVDMERASVRARGTVRGRIDDAQLAGLNALPIDVEFRLEEFKRQFQTKATRLAGQTRVRVILPEFDVSQALRAFGTGDQLANIVAGSARAGGLLYIPLDSVGQKETYRAEAVLASSALTVGGVRAADVAASLTLAEGIASLTGVQARLGEAGRLAGEARVGVVPGGNLELSLSCKQLDIAALVEQLPDTPNVPVAGVLDGQLKASVPVMSVADRNAWRATGGIHVAELKVRDQTLTNAQVDASLQDGRVALTALRAEWIQTKITSTATMQLQPPHPFRLDFQTETTDLVAVARALNRKLPSEASAKAELMGSVTGTVQPLSWAANGSAELTDLAIGEIKLAEAEIQRWAVDQTRLQITGATSNVFGGRVTANVELPLNGERHSKIDGRFEELAANSVKQLVPRFEPALDGQFTGQFSLENLENLAEARGELRLDAATLSVDELDLTQLKAEVSLQEKQVKMTVGGIALGSQFKFGSTTVLPADRLADINWDQLKIPGELVVERIELAQFGRRLFPRLEHRAFQGRANVQMKVLLSGPDFAPSGEGKLVAEDLRWRGRRMTRQLQSSLRLRGNTLAMERLTFDFGGGRISGRMALRLDEIGAGNFQLSLDRVEGRQLMVLWPDIARRTDIAVNANFRGSFARRRIRGDGSVQLSSGRFYGVPIRSLVAPINWTLNTATGAMGAEIDLRQADISGGRITGRTTWRWNGQLDVRGDARLVNVDLQPVSDALPFIAQRVTGRVSGSVNLYGRRVSSLNDLAGTYDLTLNNAQLLKLPVLSSVSTALGIGDRSTSFNETELRGRLLRGVAYIDRMTMEAAAIHMYIDGKVTTRGQLDLNITADTGQLLAASAVIGIIRPIDFVRRRLIFLHMGGTVRSPVILPRTEKFVEQEILLFFVPFIIY